MRIEDLGLMPYRDAWRYQEQVHADVLAGEEERLLLVEHPPVVTLGRRPNVARNIITAAEELQRMGVAVVETDRGGDVTFHGPGQIVAYPIVRLIDHRLSVGAYVRRLEETVIAALGDIGIAAQKDACAVGVWVDEGAGRVAKICALGVRIRRGVTMHGIALNVATDLRYFNLIIPCGLSGRLVTSVMKVLGDRAPDIETVKRRLTERIVGAFLVASREQQSETIG